MVSINRPVDGMFRAGQISRKAAKRLSAQHGWSPGKGAKTKGQMVPFNTKGTRDEGGVRNPGVLKVGHLEQARHQKAGSPATGAGLPSKGARVQGPQRRPARSNEINDSAQQEPEWPPGARASGSGAPPRLSAQAGRIPPSGGYYGGGGQDTQ